MTGLCSCVRTTQQCWVELCCVPLCGSCTSYPMLVTSLSWHPWRNTLIPKCLHSTQKHHNHSCHFYHHLLTGLSLLRTKWFSFKTWGCVCACMCNIHVCSMFNMCREAKGWQMFCSHSLPYSLELSPTKPEARVEVSKSQLSLCLSPHFLPSAGGSEGAKNLNSGFYVCIKSSKPLSHLPSLVLF